MSNRSLFLVEQGSPHPWSLRRLLLHTSWLAVVTAVLSGCGRSAPSATVEGTLRYRGKPLGHCLITFLPESPEGTDVRHSTGLTDQSGHYRLRFADQTEGAAVGMHHVTIQDMLVSTGVQRRDNGTVDAHREESPSVVPVRHSRMPEIFMSPSKTPLRKEIQPDHQVIDLDIN